jgi:hypothetical protein
VKADVQNQGAWVEPRKTLNLGSSLLLSEKIQLQLSSCSSVFLPRLTRLEPVSALTAGNMQLSPSARRLARHVFTLHCTIRRPDWQAGSPPASKIFRTEGITSPSRSSLPDQRRVRLPKCSRTLLVNPWWSVLSCVIDVGNAHALCAAHLLSMG